LFYTLWTSVKIALFFDLLNNNSQWAFLNLNHRQLVRGQHNSIASGRRLEETKY